MLNKSEYILTINITPDCQARPNCAYAIISGKKNDLLMLNVSEGFQTNSKKAEPIELADSLRGFYTAASENPRAVSGAEVVWLDGKGNQYLVSIKRGTKEDVISLANSVIQNRRNGK
ncbi:MAG: hypothetical protein ACR2F2_01065 [Pyrinomonadaceae bacterium]